MRFGLVMDQSRKAKAAKHLYDFVRTKTKAKPLQDDLVATWPVQSGLQLLAGDRFRVLDLHLHEEHMSPYFKTDMNLFHMLMLDDTIEMSLYRASEGILFVFEGLPDNPQPFGSHGHDPR